MVFVLFISYILQIVMLFFMGKARCLFFWGVEALAGDLEFSFTAAALYLQAERTSVGKVVSIFLRKGHWK